MNVCLITAGARDDAAPLVESLRTLASDAATWTVAIPGPAGGDEGTVRVAAVSDLAGEQFDVAIAADWRAARWLFEVAATRHVLVVGELAHEDLHPADTDRVLATVAINLPVDLIATSATVADELRAMRPEARVFLATGEAAGVLDEIRATPPPADALLPRRLVADLSAVLIAFRLEYTQAISAYERLEQDELVRVGTAIRSAYRSDRMAPLRRRASPIVVRAKRRLSPGEDSSA